MKFMPLMLVMLFAVAGNHQEYVSIGSNAGPTFRLSRGELQGARLMDKFGPIKSNDEKARLDNYAIELNNDPTSMGYVIVYGRTSRPGEAKKRADRIKQYLAYYRGIDMRRLVSLDHCYRTRLEVELWIVPRGAAPPASCVAGRSRAR
jgi:hypothetical protein